MDKRIETYVNQVVKCLDFDDKEKSEIIDEMRDHLFLLKQDFLQEGFSEEQAIQLTLKEFGEQEQIIDAYQTVFPNFNLFKLVTWTLFALYVYLVLYFLLIQRVISRILNFISMGETHNEYFFYPKGSNGFFDVIVWKENTNIIPFQNIMYYIGSSESLYQETIIYNTLGNILVFIPLGIFLVFLFKRFNTLRDVVKISIIVSMSLEILQFVLQLGQFDIDDIILNVIGSIVGFALLKLINTVKNSLKMNSITYS